MNTEEIIRNIEPRYTVVKNKDLGKDATVYYHEDDVKKAIAKALIIYGVSSSITLSKGNRSFNVQITSKSSFFNEPIVYKLEDGCIYLRHSTIDDVKNKVVPQLDKKNNFYHFYISVGDEEIELKKYDFEDDSTEDCVIIYYY